MNPTDTVTALSRTLASTATMQLAEIHCLDAFGTPIEERFERITRLGQRALRVPVVAITAITHETQWFKSVLGWTVSEIPITKSLCRRVVESGKAVMIGDLRRNLHYKNHSSVVSGPRFRFYCGYPLRNARGTVIGTFCVMGRKPRKFSSIDRQILSDLAILAERELLTVELRSAQTALIAKLSVARRQALVDPLTRTWNRRGGELLLREALDACVRDEKCLAVLAVDVDNFKMVNDIHGHGIGDRALRMVARELTGCVRDGDGVCRSGGDEFFVVLSGVNQSDIGNIASRLSASIERNRIIGRDGKQASVTVSVGIGFAASPESVTPEEILSIADKDLYEQKTLHGLSVDVG